ncbi:uncharacterized protein NECHADRAFT_79593 [Fusarium vanettenii 77-13-4]|uniref:Peptidase A2 domain-containing protein n=1 Tax=Fusarium vanettenii (strain ATCC MYA-4622 / CBS 123669 / FGSC 9596 / NRRL 45880 / 77-13-4) TaxID=660122 RepID=C7Z7X7_FUSV7|nr:uncharacterized protein NECHADRAFT_79593 [Fusarium vanettenii 77-13-4]EEU39902.1 hypothetical protein NECHADRAFT_79593 [Fusarium vanettenii 77-13-4]
MASALGIPPGVSAIFSLFITRALAEARETTKTWLPDDDKFNSWLGFSPSKGEFWLTGTLGRGKSTRLRTGARSRSQRETDQRHLAKLGVTLAPQLAVSAPVLSPQVKDAIDADSANSYTWGRIGEYNTVPRDLKDYSVKAKVGKHHVDALPDTGAQCNLISLQLAEKAGLVPRKGTEQAIRLPTGKQVSSPGAVRIPFSFLGEAKEYMLKCWIIPGCNRDLILSREFLDATKTLTKFIHRITSKIRKVTRRHRLNLLGDERQRIWGGVNNSLALALPDTGSDVMLVSAEYTRRNNLDVERGPEHQLELGFGDGSTAFTTGVVRNAEWAFGDSGQKVLCDLYVLDDLSVDVVLSGDFVFEFGVFDRFSRFLVHLDSLPDLSELYNIRLIGKYSPELQRLETLCYNDLNSPHAFSPRAVKAERVRRDQIRDAINALPSAEQAESWVAEHRRQELWEGFRAKHRPKQGAMTTSSVPSLRTLPGQCQKRVSERATAFG